MGNRKKARSVSEAEFNVEIGDINGRKLFEFPLKRKEKGKKKK